MGDEPTDIAFPPRDNASEKGWSEVRSDNEIERDSRRRLLELYNQMDDAVRDWQNATSGNAGDFAAICMIDIWRQIREELR